MFDPAREERRVVRASPLLSARSPAVTRWRFSCATGGWRSRARSAAPTPTASSSIASEPALVASSPAQAYALAADLAALIDDMTIEGVDWSRLERLEPEEYDRYWRITLDFLKIAFAHWPDWLRENGLVDRAKRTALMVEAEIKALESGARRGPTIIAGSTGANRATAELIAAIARSGKGAVVLPALDKHLEEGVWDMIGVSDDAPRVSPAIRRRSCTG